MEENTRSETASRMRKRLAMILIVGTLALVVMVMLSLCCGTKNYSLGEVWESLNRIYHDGIVEGIDRTVFMLRLPRVLSTFAVGAGLAVAGIVFQASIRNPLVDPYMTGVSSGAGLGATLYIIFFSGIAMSGSYFGTPFFAFIFAVLAFGITFTVAKISGSNNVSFVLAGVITAMGFSAFTTILLLTNESKTHSILDFLYGSFSSVSWNTAWIMIIPVLVISAIFICYSRTFNVILLGREQSMELGVNYDTFRILSMLLASLLTAVCVAFVGIIGFVGLIVPHLARMALGGDHRLLFPASMVIGALLLSSADLLIKEVINISGISIPVGALTTLIGIPFFVFILKKRGKGYGV